MALREEPFGGMPAEQTFAQSTLECQAEWKLKSLEKRLELLAAILPKQHLTVSLNFHPQA